VDCGARIASMFAAAILLLGVISSPLPAQRTEPVVADHLRTDIGDIPASCIERTRSVFRLAYGHTSHGSQIVSGMQVLMDGDLSGLFDFNHDGAGGALSLWDRPPGGDLGNPDRVTWAARTRDMLAVPGCDRNIVMWSWCGQASTATGADIDTYLSLMAALETDYPGVTFIYMTGHLDGSGVDGNLNLRNEQIRDHCTAGNRVLFDFADIESYDPDGNYFLDLEARDSCDYVDRDGNPGNWAEEWCAAHLGECSSVSCAHSEPLNCDLKGRAFWWMMTQLGVEAAGECRRHVQRLMVARDDEDVVLTGGPSHPRNPCHAQTAAACRTHPACLPASPGRGEDRLRGSHRRGVQRPDRPRGDRHRGAAGSHHRTPDPGGRGVGGHRQRGGGDPGTPGGLRGAPWGRRHRAGDSWPGLGAGRHPGRLPPGLRGVPRPHGPARHLPQAQRRDQGRGGEGPALGDARPRRHGRTGGRQHGLRAGPRRRVRRGRLVPVGRRHGAQRPDGLGGVPRRDRAPGLLRFPGGDGFR